MQRQLVSIGPYDSTKQGQNTVVIEGQQYIGTTVTPADSQAFRFRIAPYLRLNSIATQDLTQGYRLSWPQCPQVPGPMPLIALVTLASGDQEVEEIVDSRWYVYDKPIKRILFGLLLPLFNPSQTLVAPPEYLTDAFAAFVYNRGGGHAWKAITFVYKMSIGENTELSSTPFDLFPSPIPLWMGVVPSSSLSQVFLDTQFRETAPPVFENPINLFGNTKNAPINAGVVTAGPFYVLPQYQSLRLIFQGTDAQAHHVQVFSSPGYSIGGVEGDGNWGLVTDIPAANWKDQTNVNPTYVLEINPQPYYNEWLYPIAPGGAADTVGVAGQAIARLI